MKTKEELITAWEETKKALQNNKNKVKEEVIKESNKLMKEINNQTIIPIRAASERFEATTQHKIVYKALQIEPQVCIREEFISQRAHIESTSSFLGKINPFRKNNKPVFVINQPHVLTERTGEKELKWLGQKKIPLIGIKYNKGYKTVERQRTLQYDDHLSARVQSQLELCHRIEDKGRKFTNKPEFTIAKNREMRYKPINSQTDKLEKQIEKINRKIKGAREMNNYLQSKIELAIAGIKSMEKMQDELKNMEMKCEVKEAKIKDINSKLTETLKNKRAKISLVNKQLKEAIKNKNEKLKEYNTRAKNRYDQHKNIMKKLQQTGINNTTFRNTKYQKNQWKCKFDKEANHY
jgi:hypothetical protein